MTSLQPPAFMSFGFTEILMVGTVALLVFGGQLPDVMRNLGRAYGKFRQGMTELSRPVREELRKVREMPTMSDMIDGSEMADGASGADGGAPDGGDDISAPDSEYAMDVDTDAFGGGTGSEGASDEEDLFDVAEEPPPV